ncbi:MAG: hypothetical protein WKF76_10365 [Nocardioidaceae bacterium]
MGDAAPVGAANILHLAAIPAAGRTAVDFPRAPDVPVRPARPPEAVHSVHDPLAVRAAVRAEVHDLVWLLPGRQWQLGSTRAATPPSPPWCR